MIVLILFLIRSYVDFLSECYILKNKIIHLCVEVLKNINGTG